MNRIPRITRRVSARVLTWGGGAAVGEFSVQEKDSEKEIEDENEWWMVPSRIWWPRCGYRVPGCVWRFHGHSIADIHADVYPADRNRDFYTLAHSYLHIYTNCHVHTDCNLHAHAHRHAYPDRHCDTYAYRHIYADGHRDCHAQANYQAGCTSQRAYSLRLESRRQL